MKRKTNKKLELISSFDLVEEFVNDIPLEALSQYRNK